MNRELIWTAVRQNWYLVVIVLVCFGIPILRLMQLPSGAASPQVGQTANRAELLGVDAAANDPPLTPERARSEAIETIEAHRQAVAADPQAEDAPARLQAMGNLYRQKLVDYAQAAQCYEQLLVDYPDAPNKRTAYLQLVTCYDRLGDSTNRDRICRRMMEEFPQDSQEYEFAESVLYGRETGAAT